MNIEGIIITPLKKIYNQEGGVLHGIKKSESSFINFGEAYFSTVNYKQIKGWNQHLKMTLNLIVPVGEVIFVMYDNRKKSNSKGLFFKISLSQDNYCRLTVPPNILMAFKGIKKDLNLILNISDIEHDPRELIKIDLKDINFNWDNI